MSETKVEPVHLVGAAAEYAGCHPKTVLRALRKGELVGYQRGGANCVWRIYQSDLDRWIRGEKPMRKTRAA